MPQPDRKSLREAKLLLLYTLLIWALALLERHGAI